MESLASLSMKALSFEDIFSLLIPEELLAMSLEDFEEGVYLEDYRVETIPSDTLDEFIRSVYPFEYTDPREAIDQILKIILTQGHLVEYSEDARIAHYFIWDKKGDKYILLYSGGSDIKRRATTNFKALIRRILSLPIKYLVVAEEHKFSPDKAPVLETMGQVKAVEVEKYKKKLEKRTLKLFGDFQTFTFEPYRRLSEGYLMLTGEGLYLLASDTDSWPIGQVFKGEEIDMFLGLLAYNESNIDIEVRAPTVGTAPVRMRGPATKHVAPVRRRGGPR